MSCTQERIYQEIKQRQTFETISCGKEVSDNIVTEDVRPIMVPIPSNNLNIEETPDTETSSDLNVQEIYNDDVFLRIMWRIWK